MAPSERVISIKIDTLDVAAFSMGFRLQYRLVGAADWALVGDTYFTDARIDAVAGEVTSGTDRYEIVAQTAGQRVEYQIAAAPLADWDWFGDLHGYEFKFQVD